MDLKSKALHSLNQWATCGHRGIFISSATSWTQTFRSFGFFFGMCRIDPTRVSHYVFNLFVLLNNQRLLIQQRKMEEAQVILTFLLLKYSPTKWPINTIYRGASAEKKIFIQRKQCATSNTGGDKLFLQTMFPNILVIRSQSGVTSLRDKPAAESWKPLLVCQRGRRHEVTKKTADC